MKKILVLLFVFATLLPSCKKETENLFGESVDERLSKTLTSFNDALVQAPGWKLFVYPKGLENQDIEVGGLTYYVKFTDQNRVTMVSDFLFEMADEPKESGYRLKATQRPSLIFDTYSYIHAAADPDEDVSFSPTNQGGYGWGTDFDFSFTEATPGDTIRLKGNFNGSDALLIRATQAEMTAAFGGGLSHILDVTNTFATDNSFLNFQGTGNSRIGLSFNLFLYRLNFTFLGAGGNLATVSAPFSHTTYGLHFKEPITVGGYTFQDMFWDEALGIYYINTGSGRVNITNSATPLFPFSKSIGKLFTTITVPVTPLPGQSTLFGTTYNTIKTNLKTSGYNLDLEDMNFIFDAESSTMALDVRVRQNGQLFQLWYVYYYQMNDAGLAQFALAGTNGNASLVESSMRPLLDYLEGDIFKLDYYTGSTPVLGQFTSQQNPTFFFTGTLR
jgi:hypothetical protein